MGYALVGLCAVHCRTLAARYGRGAGLRQEMIRGITRRTDESAPTVLFLQQRRPPPSRPRPPRDGPQALEIKGFRDSRRESTRFSPSEPPAPASAAIRAHFPACESALRATGGRFCRIDPPIRPPCRFAQAGVLRRRPAPPGSISRPDGAPPSPAESRRRGAEAAAGHPSPRMTRPAALSCLLHIGIAGRLDAPSAAAATDRSPAAEPPPARAACGLSPRRPAYAANSRIRAKPPHAALPAQPQPVRHPRLAGRLNAPSATAAAYRSPAPHPPTALATCCLSPRRPACAANSRIRAKPPPAALPAQPQPVRHPRLAGRLNAPSAAAATDRSPASHPPTASQTAAFHRAMRPGRQLPDPRQAPARRLACIAAACTTPRHRGPPPPEHPSAAEPPHPPAALAACGLPTRCPACSTSARGPPRRSKRHSPHWLIACTASAHRPRSLRPSDPPCAQAANSRIRAKPPPAALPAKPQPVRHPQHRGRLRPSTAAAAVRGPRHPGPPAPMRPPASEPPPRPQPRAALSTRAAQFGIIAGGTAPSRRARHRARDDATARRRGSAMARQRGGGTAACAARPAAPAPGRRRAPPQPGSSQTSRGETP